MDELFRDHPTFVPGSKWQPTSHLDEEAQEIAKQEREVGDFGKSRLAAATQHVESVANA